jgi:RNA polymerase sigma factor (TIGR02999 family)
MDDITALLVAWGRGDEAALQHLIPLVHRELHQIARRCLKGERAGHTLQPTALINEAYLRLIDVRRVDWKNRTHFLAMSARLMRRVLVDFARSRRYQKRGGGVMKVSLDEAHAVSTDRGQDLVALDEALTALSALDERKARVIEMRFFGGLTVEETAAVLDVSRETVLRDWRLARAWLMQQLLKS